ncbi:hypothetical protein ACWGST_10050 [Agromyces sp. NPDC055520]
MRIFGGGPGAGVGVVVLGLAIAVGGAGCVAGVPPLACAAIGYPSTIEIVVEGAASADVVRIAVSTPASGSGSASGSASSVEPIASADKVDDGRWQADLLSAAPSEVTLEAFGAGDAPLGTTTATLEWRRVGGTEECGGPQEAGPVVIEVVGAAG